MTEAFTVLKYAQTTSPTTYAASSTSQLSIRYSAYSIIHIINKAAANDYFYYP